LWVAALSARSGGFPVATFELNFSRNRSVSVVFVLPSDQRDNMNQWLRMWCLGIMLAVASAIHGGAAVAVNPFEVIAARNVFRLLPFEVPRHIVQEVPPKVLPKIVVTGVTDVCGRRQVLAEITEIGKPSVRPILAEGESFAGVEVVRIDVDKNCVRVRVLGEESELKLQVERPSVALPPAPVLAVRR
jgi:hypothetical protein